MENKIACLFQAAVAQPLPLIGWIDKAQEGAEESRCITKDQPEGQDSDETYYNDKRTSNFENYVSSKWRSQCCQFIL